MKKKRTYLFLPLLFLVAWFALSGGEAGRAAQEAAGVSCNSCHADLKTVIPKTHPAVPGKGLASCLPCHAPDMSGEAKKNPFAVRIHAGHVPPKGSLDCLTCHTWTPGKSFGLIGMKESWGAPSKEDMDLLREIYGTLAKEEFTAKLHANKGVACASCHGKALPRPDDTVENARCLICHGPLEQLAKKTEPKDFPDRNPHKSHLGEIACTVCHKAHGPSKVFCLDCHGKFQMKIPGQVK